MKDVPGRMLTDCSSLNDAAGKQGGTTEEKRVELDLADIRAGVAEGNAQMVWQPTEEMAADALTKRLTLEEAAPLSALCRGEGPRWAPGLRLRDPKAQLAQWRTDAAAAARTT